MSGDPESIGLRDAAAEIALTAVFGDRVNIATAASSLLAAAAILIALQLDGEREDFLAQAWALMPGLVEHHAQRFALASIDLGTRSMQ